MREPKPVIGLCGGVGAGKSRIAAEFERLGCLVISSDRLNHEVLAEPEVLRELRDWWGPNIIGADGRADRARIAEIVFADSEEKERLERLLHPLIARRRRTMIRAVENSSAIKAIVLDSPLLFESKLDRECDSIVFVEASHPERLRRLQANRGWDANELQRRETWQLPLAQKRRRSDFVIDNESPEDTLGPRVAEILAQILGSDANREERI